MVNRKLTAEELAAYNAPFATVASRKPVRVWPQEIPFDGVPQNMHDTMTTYRRWLETTDKPKLMLHATPGVIITPEVADELKAKLPNLQAIDLGKGLHYLQEDHPHAIGEGIANWHRGLEA